MMKSFLEVKGQLVKAVKLKRDLFDKELNRFKLENYLPNSHARRGLYEISKGLHPTEKERGHLVLGTYGTGKSHFALVVGNYVTKRSSSEEFDHLFRRLKEKDSDRAKAIFDIRDSDEHYLLVVIEGFDMGGVEHALLSGLKEALQREGLKKELKCVYDSALLKIAEWEKSRPDFYKRLQEATNKHSDFDFDTLVSGLKRYQEDALGVFRELYPEITTDIFEPFFGKSVAQVYEDACKEIRNEGSHAGIFVIWDQFSDHLNTMSADKLGKDASILRDFTETVEGSAGNQIHLVLITHRELGEYLRDKGLSRQNLEYWDSIVGRLHRLLLTEIENAEELISCTITKRVDSEEWARVKQALVKSTTLTDWMKEIQLFPEKNTDLLQEIVLEGCFPLHPVVTYCLPRVSELVGLQQYRTMFTFLEYSERGGLTGFINANESFTAEGKPNFYRVSGLFDFFEDAMKSVSETAAVVSSYDAALAKASSPDDPLTQAVLKTICLISAVKKKEPTTPLMRTPDHISLMLGTKDTEVKSLIENLEEQEAIWSTPKGELELRGTRVRFDLEADLARTKSEHPLDNPSLSLAKRYPPEELPAKDYERQYYVDRRLSGVYLTPESLGNLVSYEEGIKTNYEDGRIFYALAESKDDIQTAKRNAINIDNSQIVVAIPRDPLDYSEPLRNLEALQRLRTEATYSRPDEEPFFRLQERENFEIENLKRALSTLTDPASIDLFWCGKTVTIPKGKQLDQIASIVMKEVYPKTPVVKHRKMANLREYDQKEDRIKLNTAILDVSQKEIPFLTEGGKKPPDMAILEQSLGDLGMTKPPRKDGYRTYFELKEPSDGSVKEIWNLISGLLKTSSPDFMGLYSKLRAPPYGVSPRVIEILLSAFFHFYRTCFTIRTRRSKHAPLETKPFTGETMYEILKDPERVRVEYRRDPPHGEKFRKALYEVIGRGTGDSFGLDATALSNRLLEWYGAVPDITKNAPELSETTRTFCKKMNEIVAKVTEIDVNALMYEELPEYLGIEAKFEAWHDEDLDRFQTKLREVSDEIAAYPDIIKAKVKQVLVAVFDISGDTEIQVISSIGDWFKKIPQKVKQFKGLSTEERALMKSADIKHDTTVEETFMRSLPSALELGSYERWIDAASTLKTYQTILKRTKKGIDEKGTHMGGKTAEPEAKKISKSAGDLETKLREVIANMKLGPEDVKAVLLKLLEEF